MFGNENDYSGLAGPFSDFNGDGSVDLAEAVMYNEFFESTCEEDDDTDCTDLGDEDKEDYEDEGYIDDGDYES